MSGVEFIVSTVLAVLPLALEAYDHSGRVFEVFSAFKQYPREVLILEAKLGAQRTIFRNNVINLLSAITKDRARVQDVMNQPSVQAARDGLILAPVFSRRLNSLNDSFLACRQTAEQISGNLRLLCSQFEVFKAEVGENKDKLSGSDWLKHIKTRFKLGLNKPVIGKAVEELRELNRDFTLITEQITRALQEILNEHQFETTYTKRSAKSLNRLQKYHQVRYASKSLYSTLQVRWICSSHRCHSFDMRIVDDDRRKGKARASVSDFVTCELAVTHDGSSYASKTPLRLEVEQSCGAVNEETKPGPEIQEDTNLERLNAFLETDLSSQSNVESSDLSSSAKPHRFMKGLRRDNKLANPFTVGKVAPKLPEIKQSGTGFHVSHDDSESMVIEDDSSVDLTEVNDFCKKFHEAMIYCSGRSLVGSLARPQAQWFCVPPAPQTAVGTSQSLSDIIHWVAEEPILRSFPRPLLVELASNVAEGIMQFYSTPWLVPNDLGGNIRYFSPSESTSSIAHLEGPYFKARLESTILRGKKRRASSGAAAGGLEGIPQSAETLVPTANFTEARNRLLFNFGILLLEIGFGRPWIQLRQSVVKLSSANGNLSDYRIAEKLAQLLINQMGLTYPKIIKKCLGCDFGLGETDLDNEDLQRQFLEDVVSGLQQLKEQMGALNFAL